MKHKYPITVLINSQRKLAVIAATAWQLLRDVETLGA